MFLIILWFRGYFDNVCENLTLLCWKCLFSMGFNLVVLLSQNIIILDIQSIYIFLLIRQDWFLLHQIDRLALFLEVISESLRAFLILDFNINFPISYRLVLICIILFLIHMLVRTLRMRLITQLLIFPTYITFAFVPYGGQDNIFFNKRRLILFSL